ncbi:MAG TPA: AAA family ATPase, partial [Flavisolibacter sp.]|nr:AAA family ATPase [Flavisolibacter sp.]
KNNVGKSSFLSAYEFFVTANQKAIFSDFYNHNSSVPIVMEAVFLKETIDDTDEELAGKAKGKKVEPDWIEKWVDDQNLVRIKKIWNKQDESFSKHTFSPKENSWVEGGFGGLHTLFQRYAPTPIVINAMETETSLEEKVNKLIQDEFLKKLKEEHPEEFSDIVGKIKHLQSKITGSDVISQYNSEINQYFRKVFSELTLKIEPKHEEGIKIEDAFKKNHSVTVTKEGATRNELINQYGHGVIRQALFNFISFLKKNWTDTRKQYLILFEEPELFLHPEATFKLRKCLYDLAEQSPFQILCATHSPMMIDLSRPHASLVRVTKSSDETTNTYQVGDDVFRGDEYKKERLQMINRFNPHVCESFYASHVIIVEGDTEAIVYRDLIGRFFNQFEVYVLNAGSKNNIPFFQEIFTAFHILHCIVHDTDTKLDKNGDANSAWTLNTRIWEKIQSANLKSEGLARRYVHIENFEKAHGIKLTGKEKPIKAYEFVRELLEDSDAPCLNWLKDMLGTKAILHDDSYIDNLFG